MPFSKGFFIQLHDFFSVYTQELEVIQPYELNNLWVHDPRLRADDFYPSLENCPHRDVGTIFRHAERAQIWQLPLTKILLPPLFVCVRNVFFFLFESSG